MATLTIRNLPDEVHARLRIRAAKNGRSMEAEAREILNAEVGGEEPTATAEDLQRWIDEQYGDDRPTSAVDELIAERRWEAAKEEAEFRESEMRHRGRT